MSVVPYNRDAELAVLGCILSAGGYSPEAGRRILARVRGRGLVAADFWLQSNGVLYAVLERRADEGLTLDAISVADDIENEAWKRLGNLADLAHTNAVNTEILRGRLEMLAAAVTAFGNCEAYADIVVRQARKRERSAA